MELIKDTTEGELDADDVNNNTYPDSDKNLKARILLRVSLTLTNSSPRLSRPKNLKSLKINNTTEDIC